MRIQEMGPELYAGMEARVSRRKYTAAPSAEELAELARYAAELNRDADGAVRIGVWADGAEEVFGGLTNSYGMFSGVRAFAGFIGRSGGDGERTGVLCGYYGEQFILKATAMGLGTCWVAGTFDKSMARRIAGVNEGETLYCVSPLGAVPEALGLRERLVKGFSAKRSRKPLADLLTSPEALAAAPAWMASALESARIGPSAMNAQPWRFRLAQDRQAITAYLASHPAAKRVDLGIALAHIEIAALQAGVRGVWTEGEEPHAWTFQAEDVRR
ncbi:nitroreductase family protein [Gorillibacterium sp. sgz500922]|uniref:nitroreductase family protein n=1 Tax=Gorillibacterium sp. sgz500922 TaxID=3446694 RepID=UPI003F68124A